MNIGGFSPLLTPLLFFSASFALFSFLLIRPPPREKRDPEGLRAPPQKTINLGLDLQGGIHLVLGVEADKHVASQTDRAAEDLKSQLERKGIAVKRVAREGGATIVVELASPQAWNDLLTVVGDLQRFERRDEDAAAGRLKLWLNEQEADRLRHDPSPPHLHPTPNPLHHSP